MKNKLWSVKHLIPESWTELVYGVIMIGITIMMVIVVIGIFILPQEC